MQTIRTAGKLVVPPGDAPNHYVEHLRVPTPPVGRYSIPAGGVDDQTPHSEDEIYVVTAGRARLVSDSGTADVGPGDVIYVPAGEAHWFVDVTGDLALLVVFAPAYRSRVTRPSDG